MVTPGDTKETIPFLKAPGIVGGSMDINDKDRLQALLDDYLADGLVEQKVNLVAFLITHNLVDGVSIDEDFIQENCNP